VQKENASTVVFDISRTISGAGQGSLTGIDRVERAYLEHFLSSPRPVLFLVRIKGRSALLNGLLKESKELIEKMQVFV